MEGFIATSVSYFSLRAVSKIREEAYPALGLFHSSNSVRQSQLRLVLDSRSQFQEKCQIPFELADISIQQILEMISDDHRPQ